MRRCTSTLERCIHTKRACWNDVNDKPNKKNAKKKKGVHTKRVCWTAVSDKPSKKIPKQNKGAQHKDFPGGHPSQYYSRANTPKCGVLMGSGALVLV